MSFYSKLISNRLRTVVGVVAVCASFHISPAFAGRAVIANLASNQRLVSSLIYYFQEDHCYGCRGGARTSGVNQLQIVEDEYRKVYFQGFVWANSYHPHGLAYGGPIEGEGDNIEGRGLLKVDFSIPMHFNGNMWIADYSRITKRDSFDPVRKVNRKKVRFVNCFLDNPLTYCIANCIFPRLRPTADTVEIDLEQVFELSRPYIDRLELNRL